VKIDAVIVVRRRFAAVPGYNASPRF